MRVLVLLALAFTPADAKGPSLSSSAAWQPLVLKSCRPGTPAHYAPCLLKRHKSTNLELAHELLYPAFKLAMPGYATPADREQYLAYLTRSAGMHDYRFTVTEGFLLYTSRLNGQALVFSNATYTGDPPSAWNPASCVEHGVRHSSLLTKRPRRGAAVQGGPFQPDVPIAAVATSPDSESFAHFTDRVVNVWAQALLVLGSLRAAGLLGNGTSAPGAAPPRSTGVDVITGRASRNQIVQQLVSALGMGRTLYDNPIRASVMIFTCRVPLIHPYIFLKFAELLGVQQNIPMEQRKAVVYMPRSDSTANGRLLLNQDALLRAIEDMLQKRNQSERLVLFSASKYPTLGELITFFRQARAIVAPDGAAMYNARFAPRDTLVLETMPSERMAVMFHEQSHLIGQPYVVHVSKSLNGSRHDMEVDVSAVVGALERNLGITGIKTVLPYYPWVFDT